MTISPEHLPGTVFATRGAGAVGWLIRHISGSFYGHTGIIISQNTDGTYLVAEALWSFKKAESGLRLRDQDFADHDHRFTRFMQVPNGLAVAETSKAAAELQPRYDTKELLRIAARGLGIKWGRPESDARICSAAVTEAVVLANPDLDNYFPDSTPALSAWPGLLIHCLGAWLSDVRK